MKLILVRHADAASLGHDGLTPDAVRPLSELGQKQATELAKALAVANVTAEAIVTSPLTRAIETAAKLTTLCTDRGDAFVCEFLSLEGYKPRKLIEFITLLDRTPIILVGHMPSLSQFAGWLIGAPATAVEFTRAAACFIDVPRKNPKGKGTIRWMLTPKFTMPVEQNAGVETQIEL